MAKPRTRIALVIDVPLGRRLEGEKIQQRQEAKAMGINSRITLSDVVRGLLEHALEAREKLRVVRP